jgi:hypothetical protein
MNDQNENLVRQSKWSGRRVVLFYWFAIVFLGTSAAAGLGTSVFKPVFSVEADSNHDGITEPWGPTDCQGAACHNDTVTDWNTTWHAQAVQPFPDGADDPQNGSRWNYNSTHYWRIPNSMTNESEPTNFTNVAYWTYNEIFNASGQQCCMTTRWTNTTLLNSTTGEVIWTNDTLVAQYGGNIWDIGVSCAACHDEPGEFDLSYRTCSGCHTPGGRQWMGYVQSGHYGSLDDLLASGDIASLVGDGYWSYVGQSTYMGMNEINASDYYGITCATCHDPHDSSISAAKESTAFSPWKNPYTNETFGPGGSQLREATTADLCGTCHDASLNTSGTYRNTTGMYNYFLDPTKHEGLDCTDCHGYKFTPAKIAANGTVLANSSVSEEVYHDWKFTYGETGCGVCHNATTSMNSSTALTTMNAYLAQFGSLTALEAKYDTKLAAAMAAYNTGKATEGVDIDKLANAYALIEEAKDLAKGTSLVFHNPELGSAVEEEQLSLALTKLDDALDDATDALPEPEEPTTTTVPVTTTTEEPTTTAPAPAIGLLAVMSILGVVALFYRKRR